jgi:hypothetical protein
LVAVFVFHENAARFLSHAPLLGVPPGSKVFLARLRRDPRNFRVPG